MGKYIVVGRATEDNVVHEHCIAINTHLQYVIYRFSTVTVVAPTYLSDTLYVHCYNILVNLIQLCAFVGLSYGKCSSLKVIIIFSGSAAQRGLWPPVALQPSTGYGLLWLCSPARAMASCGSAAQRGLWPPRFTRFLDHTQRRATVGRTPLHE
jgi:hypothetical protein